MTQRTRRRQRRRGGIGTKLLLVAGVILVLAAIAAIGVTSWVLDVAAEGAVPVELQAGRPRRQLNGLRRGREQARRDRLQRSARAGLDRAHPRQPPAGDGGDRGPALLRARRRRRGGHPARRGERRRSRRSGRGRLDDHPAAGPQPLHPQPGAARSNARSSRRSWRKSTPRATRGGKSSAPTSTSPPTARSKAQPRSVSGRRRGSTSRSRSGSSTCRRRRCSPACRRRRPNTTRSSTRRLPKPAATRCWRR